MLERYQSIIETHARRTGVPVSWIQAVIMTESSGNANAYRPEPSIGDASYGLMQLLVKTARGLGFNGDPSELFDPDINIRLGADLLKQLRGRFGTDFDAIYSAYNSGSPTKYLTSSQVAANVSRARGWLQSFLTPETAIGGIGIVVVALLIWWAVQHG